MTDTAGITSFFSENREAYMMPERAEVSIYTINNAKLAKKMEKKLSRGKSTDKIISKAAKKDALAISTSRETIRKGVNELLDSNWQEGVVKNSNEDGDVVLYHIVEIKPERKKELEESWGSVSADYQTELERLWVESLRDTFSYTIFKEALAEVEEQILNP